MHIESTAELTPVVEMCRFNAGSSLLAVRRGALVLETFVLCGGAPAAAHGGHPELDGLRAAEGWVAIWQRNPARQCGWGPVHVVPVTAPVNYLSATKREVHSPGGRREVAGTRRLVRRFLELRRI